MTTFIQPQEPTLTPMQFIAKWQDTAFGEKQASQEMFLDLCALVGHPTPAAYGRPELFTFEKPVPGGFADAYKEGHFAWEFKSSDRQLEEGMRQTIRYAAELKNPPLLIVSTFRTIRIRTNFRGKERVIHEIPVALIYQPGNLEKLRWAFFDPDRLEPESTVEQVTQETANLFYQVVEIMEERDEDPEKLARYLNQLIFCLYAEDTGLLPAGIFSYVIRQQKTQPDRFNRAISDLFSQMAEEGGMFGGDDVAYFNGDLFQDAEIVELTPLAIRQLANAAAKDWSNIEPSIFGTLFERVLDAGKRSQLGAHYTGAEDIMLVVEPVVLAPLRREWAVVQQAMATDLGEGAFDTAQERLEQFRRRLFTVTVLDPACGSGNFLYIALRSLLDLEKEVITYAAEQGWNDLTPRVKPNQMLGLEINPYAAELARTALWIGYIQWHRNNGFAYNQQPIMTPLDTVRQADAILDLTDPDNPKEPEWPAADFIVSNPPFLGHFPFREQLGDEYVDAVYQLYGERIPNSSDICCYWLEKARAQIESGQTKRAGLLATQAIRFQSNREVLNRIRESGDIFNAISDHDWVLEGANVHISIICFDDGSETARTLDDEPAANINANLTVGADLTLARALPENADLSFMGDIKVGPFELTAEVAAEMLAQPNPHGKPNSDVVKRWLIGRDINQVAGDKWIIDFGVDMPEADAALYEAPFEYVKAAVKPQRDNNRDARFRNFWWLHGAPRIKMRESLAGLSRYIGTSMVSKHRIFAWIDGAVLPDATIIVFPREDDYFFGVLHSRIHGVWAAATGTQLESRPRYTPTTCFQTFPFPEPTEEQRAAIGEAAAELNRLRENWRNPVDMLGNALLTDAQRRQRTLTNLYNQRPQWLENAHSRLDAAVAAAYGWSPGFYDQVILGRLLALNLERAGVAGEPATPP